MICVTPLVGTCQSCILCNIRPGLCTCNLYRCAYVANANWVRERNRRKTMRSIVLIVLPIIAAVSTSGLMFTATLV